MAAFVYLRTAAGKKARAADFLPIASRNSRRLDSLFLATFTVVLVSLLAKIGFDGNGYRFGPVFHAKFGFNETRRYVR